MKVFGIIRTIFAAVLVVFMISLWNWNVIENSTTFAVLMILLALAIFGASLADNIISFRNGRNKG